MDADTDKRLRHLARERAIMRLSRPNANLLSAKIRSGELDNSDWVNFAYQDLRLGYEMAGKKANFHTDAFREGVHAGLKDAARTAKECWIGNNDPKITFEALDSMSRDFGYVLAVVRGLQQDA